MQWKWFSIKWKCGISRWKYKNVLALIIYENLWPRPLRVLEDYEAET